MTGELHVNPIKDRLNEAIDQLQKDVQRVEIWAGALSAYASPVAEYEVDEKHRLPQPVAAGAFADSASFASKK